MKEEYEKQALNIVTDSLRALSPTAFEHVIKTAEVYYDEDNRRVNVRMKINASFDIMYLTDKIEQDKMRANILGE